MAHKELFLALGILTAAAPVAASQPDPAPAAMAPAGTPDTKYCLRVEAVTGSNVETVRCWTRAEWADQGVDVDAEWAEEGVRVIEA
jgi:hypothetical protein